MQRAILASIITTKGCLEHQVGHCPKSTYCGSPAQDSAINTTMKEQEGAPQPSERRELDEFEKPEKASEGVWSAISRSQRRNKGRKAAATGGLASKKHRFQSERAASAGAESIC